MIQRIDRHFLSASSNLGHVWVEQLETRRFLSASPVSDEFTAGTYMAFYGNNLLTAVNLASGATKSYPLGAWNQEFTFTAGSGSSAENILAFYAGSTLTTVNLTSQVETSYNVGTSTEQWTAMSVAAFFNHGTLTTVDVGSGEMNTYNVGNFSQEFTVSSTSTSMVTQATSNVLAFYGNKTLTTINVLTQNLGVYGVGDFSQEYTLTVGTGAAAQTVLAFFAQETLTTVNLITQNAAAYLISQGSTDVFPAGSVLAFYRGGILSTVDVGSGDMNSYSVGNFSQEFTASSTGTGTAAINNILAFYGNGTLTTVNVNTQDVERYPLAEFTQEWALGIGSASGGTGQTALAFDAGGTLVAINLATHAMASYPVPAQAVQEWLSGTAMASGSVVGFYADGTLTTVDVGAGKVNTFNVGNFSDAFTVYYGTGATAAAYVAFYDNQNGMLTAVNLTAGNLTPAEDIGSWTAEFTPMGSTVMAFYDKGTLTAEDVSTGTLSYYQIGAYTTEFTTAPATATLGVLAFYDAGTITAANFSTGDTTALSNVGPWTEEWTGSTFAASTAPTSPSAAPSAGSPSAAAASGMNILAFYDAGTITGVDVAANTVSTLLSAAVTSDEVQSGSSDMIAASPPRLLGIALQPGGGSVLENDLKAFKSSLIAIASRASKTAQSLTAASARRHAEKPMATSLAAERIDLKTLASAVHTLSEISIARVLRDSNRLRREPINPSLSQTLTADIDRLETILRSGETMLAAVNSTLIGSPEALGIVSALTVAQSDLKTLSDQLG